MAEWKKVIVSGSNAELATLNATAVTASLLGNVVGDLTGTASWATNVVNVPLAVSASYATSASYAMSSSFATQLATAQDFSITGGGITATAVSFNGTGDVVLDASIDSGAVGTDELAADAVTNAKLADNAVETLNIVDLNVTTGKIADDAITTAKIEAGAVGTTELAASAVTNAKLAIDAVQTANIVDLNVTTGKLAAGAVTTDKIADANVTNAKLANSSLTVGSTNIALGASATTLAGLTSVTSTDFIGDLTGNADTATTANTASYVAATSAAQGQVTVTGNVIDLGLETTDSVTFANQSIAGSGSYGGSLVVQGDLTVNGTASFINTQELLVEDKFVTFASGSEVATDGGFIVSQAAGNIGQAFGYSNSQNQRWGVQATASYDTTSITPDAYVSLVAVSNTDARYQKTGNIFVDGSGDIFIWGGV